MLHGKGGNLARSQLRESRVLVGGQLADQHGTGFQLGNAGLVQRTHGEHDVSLCQRLGPIGRNAGTQFCISRVGSGGKLPGSLLHHHGVTHGDQLFHRFRCRGHAFFTSQPFGRNSDLHGQILLQCEMTKNKNQKIANARARHFRTSV